MTIPPDTDLRCRVCGDERAVSFETSLRDGWPNCCGTLMLVTKWPQDFKAIVGRVWAEAATPVGAMKHRLARSRN